jgi:hypothetical protein
MGLVKCRDLGGRISEKARSERELKSAANLV